MSVLDGFEEKRQNVSGFYFFHAHTVIDLLAHARALEEMLRKIRNDPMLTLRVQQVLEIDELLE